MLIVNPNPIILQIGSFTLSYYLLVLMLGFLAILFTLLLTSKKKILPLKEEQIYDLVTLLILGTILGARIFHILFWGLDYYSHNLIKIFYIWEGGLSFHGGLLGAFLVTYFYCKTKKLPFLKIADLLVLPVVFFLALGRIANFFNSEILGIATNVPWCVVFQNIDNTCRHPIQLYAAVGRFILFFALLFIQKKFKQRKNGFIFWTFLLLISIGRFFLDFWRDDPAFFGLLPGQWLSLIAIVISIAAFKKLNLLKLKNV
jgi:phosphatidylglycerol:prolipoprotein diacylglycerol transferase